MHYSYSHLSYLFKKETGQSFSEYLTARRIEKACALLERSRMKIYEVAANCGYSDTNYFLKLFRRSVGTTPAQYRKDKQCGK
jgi:two-component system response regulator YesN